jgi:hypothetical protein
MAIYPEWREFDGDPHEPEELICPHCGSDDVDAPSEPGVYECNQCHHWFLEGEV